MIAKPSCDVHLIGGFAPLSPKLKGEVMSKERLKAQAHIVAAAVIAGLDIGMNNVESNTEDLHKNRVGPNRVRRHKPNRRESKRT